MPARSHRLWIATFDGASAAVFALDRENARLAPTDFAARSGPHRPEFNGDGPDTTFQSFSSERGSGDPKTDKERSLETAFVAALAADLDEAARTGAFDALIVAAGPRAMGAFRAEAPASLRQKVRGEVVANHVNTPPDQIYAALQDHL